jgi:hypothetical protein
MASRIPDIKELVDLELRSIRDQSLQYVIYNMITKIKQVWDYQEIRITELEERIEELENP